MDRKLGGLRLLACAAGLVVSGAALAEAPFCVMRSYGPPDCSYYSVSMCQQAAQAAGGMCAQNNTQPPPSGINSGAPFCVATGLSTNCMYYDANTCRQQAAASDGACIPNPNR